VHGCELAQVLLHGRGALGVRQAGAGLRRATQTARQDPREGGKPRLAIHDSLTLRALGAHPLPAAVGQRRRAGQLAAGQLLQFSRARENSFASSHRVPQGKP